MLRKWIQRFLASDMEEQVEENIMKMIVGLGNPGDKYAGSRHNVGWSAIDVLAERHSVRMSLGKMKGFYGSGVIGGEKVLLVKPTTFMNNSGECVRPLADYYKIPVNDIIIIYDDINLDVGQLRVRGKGSAGGHNGMKSLIQHLGSQDFPRIRIGVGAKPPKMDLADYVLGHFPKEELSTVRDSLDLAADAAEMLISEGIDRTMNKYNAFKRA